MLQLVEGDVHKNEYPSGEDWKNCIPKWKSLSAEPYQPVSKLTFILFNIDVCETHQFTVYADAMYRIKSCCILLSGLFYSKFEPQEKGYLEQC